ncbi:unnamed protein product [Dibothriocephalus latus]|uniref:Uncharacterized protein n=1 Tax=Dibothriocephalus latus TaxID=60516 RepID=A0A3P7LFL1_DIBLA|nr:unnamed protein product [Dibothriocephalus latus]
MAKSTMMLLIFVCIVLPQFLETSADDYTILLTYNTDVNNKTAQNHFDKLANTCKMLQNNSLTFKTFPTLENGIALEGLRKCKFPPFYPLKLLSNLSVVGVLGAENYFLRLLDTTPNSNCSGANLDASTLDVSMTRMLEVGVAYLNFLRSLQNTVDAVRITQSESTIIALPKYFSEYSSFF